MNKGEIGRRIALVRAQLREAEELAGRRPGSVSLVLVSKQAGVAEIIEAYEAGQRDFGENYLAAAKKKMRELSGHGLDGIRWHMVGQLQSNKAAWAARNFSLVHSLATPTAARAISRAMVADGRHAEALLQIHLGGGSGRGGVEPERAEAFAREVAGLGNIRLAGVMGVAPAAAKPGPHFARLRRTFEALRALDLPGARLAEISAGMSGDFREAVKEGATLVRIGQAVFGRRS